jgi:endonuclease/exonuclease/phosphatase family metal-dependent hydrolase
VPLLLFELTQLGYDYRHTYYGPENEAFALATFYKRDKFFVRAVQVHQINDVGRGHKSHMVLHTEMTQLKNNQDFHVLNTHFGIAEIEKSESASFLSTYLQGLKAQPFLCAGDYNFFDDKDGATQRQTLLNVAQDVIYPLANASGTFMGYEWDSFHCPFDKMSRLDHVFGHNIKVEKQARAYGDMQMVKERVYPSDHMMILFEFSLIV